MIWDKQLRCLLNFQAAFGIMDIFYTVEWELEYGHKTPRRWWKVFPGSPDADY